jgi:hypothetical protein
MSTPGQKPLGNYLGRIATSCQILIKSSTVYWKENSKRISPGLLVEELTCSTYNPRKVRAWVRSWPGHIQKLWIKRELSLVPECLCQSKQKITHRWTVACSGLHILILPEHVLLFLSLNNINVSLLNCCDICEKLNIEIRPPKISRSCLFTSYTIPLIYSWHIQRHPADDKMSCGRCRDHQFWKYISLFEIFSKYLSVSSELIDSKMDGILLCTTVNLFMPSAII